MRFREFYQTAKAHVVRDFCIKKETLIGLYFLMVEMVGVEPTSIVDKN